MTSQFWNDRYSEHNNLYGFAPNVFFKQELDKLKPGTLLLPGDGEGRNAIYATQQSWEVTAFDSSDVAVKKALQTAKEKELSFQYQHADTNTFEAKEDSYDAIAIIYFHLPPVDRLPFHQKLTKWLKPGGHLILECFNPKQLGKPSGGPRNTDMLYNEEQLRDEFSTLNITTLHTTTEVLNEGDFHCGEAELIRMVAQKAT